MEGVVCRYLVIVLVIHAALLEVGEGAGGSEVVRFTREHQRRGSLAAAEAVTVGA